MEISSIPELYNISDKRQGDEQVSHSQECFVASMDRALHQGADVVFLVVDLEKAAINRCNLIKEVLTRRL